MSMTAEIKLRDADNLVISSTFVTSEHYEDGPDPDEFLHNAWKMADQMATHFSCADEWRLTLTFDLDLRESIEEIMARQGRSKVMAKVYNFDDGHFSNLHKIAYGFRPKTDNQQVWDCLSDDLKQEWWDVMCRIMYAGGAK